MYVKCFLVVTFLFCSVVFSYTQESVQEDTQDGLLQNINIKQELNYEAIIITTVGLGVLFEIVGILTHIEANRRFFRASSLYSQYQADKTNSSLKSRYENERYMYEGFLYMSWGLYGLGVMSIGIGIYFTIQQMRNINSRINSTRVTQENVNYSRIPLRQGTQHNISIFIEPYAIGIGIK